MKSKYNDTNEEKNELRMEVTALLTEIATLQNNKDILEQRGLSKGSDANDASLTFLTNEIISNKEDDVKEPITVNTVNSNHFEEFILLKRENKELKLELLKYTSKPPLGSCSSSNSNNNSVIKDNSVINTINNTNSISGANNPKLSKSNKMSKSKPLF